MSIERNQERLERAESRLKNGLGNVKETMKVENGNGGRETVTLLQIYSEWMDYLVKDNYNKKEDNLLRKWQIFLLERNTDAVIDLLTGFFEAKRRYGRDQERGEHQWDWFALCKNYCAKWGRNSDEDLIHSFFSSYSAAERRIRTKVKAGKVLKDSTQSLLDNVRLTKEEAIKKLEDKKRKAEEKKRKEEEKQRRREEREKKTEEKMRQAEEKESKISKKDNVDDIVEVRDEGAENHYRGKDRDIEKDGDVILNPEYESIPTNFPKDSEDDNQDEKESEKKSENIKSAKKVKKKISRKTNSQQLEIPFDS